MKYLIANHYFGSRTGSELWSYELGAALTNRNHDVQYFGVAMDRCDFPDICDRGTIFEAGVNPRPSTPDIIVAGQYTTVAHLARLFPETPIVQILHGVTDGLDTPAPDVPSLVHYLCVSPEVYQHAHALGHPHSMISVSGQLVDDDLFVERELTKNHPRHVLVLSRRMGRQQQIIVEEAAAAINATILFVPRDTGDLHLHDLVGRINDADIVVGMGRAIIEAMFCGRTPVIYDIHGGAGTPTMDNYDDLRYANFSGRPSGEDYTRDILSAIFLNHIAYDTDNLADRARTDFGTKWVVAQLDLQFAGYVYNWNNNRDRILRDQGREAHPSSARTPAHRPLGETE